MKPPITAVLGQVFQRAWLPLVAILVPTALFVAQARRLGWWLIDDALISVAYARTLAEGGGYAQQVGAVPVEGVSNPLWTLLLAALRMLGLSDRGNSLVGIPDTVLVLKVLAVGFFVLSLVACWGATKLFSASPIARAFGVASTGIALAMSPSYVIWMVGGLENPLYGFLIALLIALFCRASISRLGSVTVAVTAAVLALCLAATRPDGVIYAAAYPLVLLATARWRPLRSSVVAALYYAVAYALPLGALLTWRYLAFGLLVPNTAIAKAVRLGVLNRVFRLGSLVFTAGPVMVFLLAMTLGAVIVLLAKQASGRRETIVALMGTVVPTLLAAAAFAIMPDDWMGEYRFATPVIVGWSVTLGVCVTFACRAKLTPKLLTAISAGIIVGAVLLAVSANPRFQRFADDPTVSGCYVAQRFGQVFNWYADELKLPATSSFLVPDLGGVLLTTRLKVVDLAGLTDARIARYRAAQDMQGLRDYVLDEVKPTLITMHGPWLSGLDKDPRFKRDYAMIVSGQVPIPGNYVRNDAVDQRDVLALRPKAAELLARIDNLTKTSPRRSCGSMTVDQPLPAEVK